MKKKKKFKLSKYSIRRFFAIVFVITIIVFVQWIIGLNKKNKKPDLSILFNNEILNTKKEVIIDEKKNIYFSKEDIQAIFDEMIYYNDAEKELITTYNKHTALLKIDEISMLVNDKHINLEGKLKEINEIIYLPIKDLKIVYDIEIEYVEEKNRIIIDSTLKEKKQAVIEKNVKLKNKKGWFKKTIEKLSTGQTVLILEENKNYKKVRTESGEIGYLKKNKIIDEKKVRDNLKEEIYSLNIYKEYSNISGIYENITVDKSKLNVVIPTFFYIGKNSKVLDKTTSKTATYANYTGWLKENNLNILPTLENTENISNTLLTYSQRNQVINELLEKIMYYQYKGININFEDIDDINSFYRFIIELTPRFKEAGLIVSVTINKDIDKNKVLKITDYIIEK